jgi:protein-S-isoprenylcysteine O-methyltransferase Ste14
VNSLVYLRIFLFAGLLFHKLVWELLKNRSRIQARSLLPIKFEIKSIVKAIKIAALFLLIVQTLFLNILPITQNPGRIRILGIFLYLLGLAVAVTGRVQLGNNWVDLEDYRVLPEQKLVRNGIYRYIRHPIYLGDVLLILGLELALNSWLVIGVVGLLVVVIRQALVEERLLVNSLPGYVDYYRQTKMFIPFII